MSTKAKAITIAFLVVFALILAYVIWIQTRLLAISIALLVITLLALYFIFKKL